MAQYGRSFIGYHNVPKFRILALSTVPGTVTFDGSLASSLTFSDSPSGTATLDGSGVENYQVFLLGTVTLDGQSAEALTAQDQPSASLSLGGSNVEAFRRSGNASVGVITVGGAVGAAEWGGGLLWGDFLWGQPSDRYSGADSPSGSITVGGYLASEVFRPPTVYRERPSGSVTLGGSLRSVYSTTYVDRPSGALTLDGASGDSKTVSNVATGTLTLGGLLRSEVWQLTYVDHPPGAATLSGSVVEVYRPTYTDLPAGSVTIDGAATEAQVVADASGGGLSADGFMRSEAYFRGGIAVDVVTGTFALNGGVTETFTPPLLFGDQLVVTGVGSTDWAGGTAPFGGTHTGQTTITMVDGVVYTVAHGAAEVFRKIDGHAISPTVPAWVAFDQPGRAVPVILNIKRILDVSVTPVTQPVVLGSVR